MGAGWRRRRQEASSRGAPSVRVQLTEATTLTDRGSYEAATTWRDNSAAAEAWRRAAVPLRAPLDAVLAESSAAETRTGGGYQAVTSSSTSSGTELDDGRVVQNITLRRDATHTVTTTTTTQVYVPLACTNSAPPDQQRYAAWSPSVQAKVPAESTYAGGYTFTGAPDASALDPVRAYGHQRAAFVDHYAERRASYLPWIVEVDATRAALCKKRPNDMPACLYQEGMAKDRWRCASSTGEGEEADIQGGRGPRRRRDRLRRPRPGLRRS